MLFGEQRAPALVARLLTGLSLTACSAGVGAVARAAWHEQPDPALLVVLFLFPGLVMPLAAGGAWMCRRRVRPAAVACGSAAAVSAVAVWCWACEAPTHPGADLLLGMARGAGGLLMAVLVLPGAVAAIGCESRTPNRAVQRTAAQSTGRG